MHVPILFSSLGSGDSAALLNAVVIGVGEWWERRTAARGSQLTCRRILGRTRLAQPLARLFQRAAEWAAARSHRPPEAEKRHLPAQ